MKCQDTYTVEELEIQWEEIIFFLIFLVLYIVGFVYIQETFDYNLSESDNIEEFFTNVVKTLDRFIPII